jgi:antibiotic biosynthesis monooxygenase (ABM) superfamily enzyme
MMARMNSRLEKMEAAVGTNQDKVNSLDFESNPEGKNLWWSVRKCPKKGPQWKLSEHWSTDMGTSI